MEGSPIVAIVGRPNVGKSTLFNRILGQRTAVVEDRARTTRDRLYGAAEWEGRRFIVVDTGGLEARPGDAIEAKVQEQARVAIREADVIVLVVDAAAGLAPGDLEAADLLRSARVPVVVAVNKADNQRLDLEAVEFHRLGWAELHPVSALHGRGTGELLDAIATALPPAPEGTGAAEEGALDAAALAAAEAAARAGAEPGSAAAAWDAQVAADAERARRPVAVAILGRPNVGKSSLLNALLGEERTIVSEIPGTTRDAIDTALERGGQAVTLIDTAGIRRRGKVASGPAAERFSTLRALRALSRAEVAILVVDAAEGLTAQDAHIAGYVVEEGRGLVVALNKWDLVEKDGRTFDGYVAAIRGETPFLDFAPVVAVSARTGLRVGRALDAALQIAAERRRRVPTGELNRELAEAAFRNEPPMVRGRRPKLFYGTQASVAPPTFVVFARHADAVHFSYRRYLENRLRGAFGFEGTPIRIVFRERSREPRGPRTDRRAAAPSGADGRRRRRR